MYYGWYVVAACNLVAVMTWGIGVFNQGVFLGYFVAEYGWSRAELSFGPTLFYVWAGLMGIWIGRLLDRRGPRPILIGGALALGAGTVVLGLARAPWHVYVGFLLLGTGYAGLHTVTLGAIVSRWFVRQRARARIIPPTFGASVGGMILAPLNAGLLESWGGPVAGLTLAVIAIAVVVPLAIWVVKDGPEAVGQRIDGDGPDAPPADAVSVAHDERDWSVRGALGTRAFWAIALSFHLTMGAQAGFLVHQVLFLQPTFGFVVAATVVSLTTVMGAVGRVAFAVAGNRWPPRRIASATFLLQAAGLAVSALGGAPWVLVVGSALFGLTMGVVVALAPVVAADCFGRRSFGRVYGALYLALQLGSALGALLFGLSASAFESYRPAFAVVSGLLVLAAVGMRWAVRPPVVPAVAGAGYTRAALWKG